MSQLHCNSILSFIILSPFACVEQQGVQAFQWLDGVCLVCPSLSSVMVDNCDYELRVTAVDSWGNPPAASSYFRRMRAPAQSVVVREIQLPLSRVPGDSGSRSLAGSESSVHRARSHAHKARFLVRAPLIHSFSFLLQLYAPCSLRPSDRFDSRFSFASARFTVLQSFQLDCFLVFSPATAVAWK